jgi:hypothetical protein
MAALVMPKTSNREIAMRSFFMFRFWDANRLDWMLSFSLQQGCSPFGLHPQTRAPVTAHAITLEFAALSVGHSLLQGIDDHPDHAEG